MAQMADCTHNVMTREQAILLARKHCEKVEPRPPYAVGMYVPDEWIINALMEASSVGRAEGFNQVLLEIASTHEQDSAAAIKKCW